jgi:hypothetical protein
VFVQLQQAAKMMGPDAWTSTGGSAHHPASTILRFAGPDDNDLQDSRTAQEIGYAAAYATMTRRARRR